jgi:hypothetical protein
MTLIRYAAYALQVCTGRVAFQVHVTTARLSTTAADVGLPGCNYMQTCRLVPQFRKNTLPASSELTLVTTHTTTRRHNAEDQAAVKTWLWMPTECHVPAAACSQRTGTWSPRCHWSRWWHCRTSPLWPTAPGSAGWRQTCRNTSCQLLTTTQNVPLWQRCQWPVGAHSGPQPPNLKQ